MYTYNIMVCNKRANLMPAINELNEKLKEILFLAINSSTEEIGFRCASAIEHALSQDNWESSYLVSSWFLIINADASLLFNERASVVPYASYINSEGVLTIVEDYDHENNFLTMKPSRLCQICRHALLQLHLKLQTFELTKTSIVEKTQWFNQRDDLIDTASVIKDIVFDETLSFVEQISLNAEPIKSVEQKEVLSRPSQMNDFKLSANPFDM